MRRLHLWLGLGLGGLLVLLGLTGSILAFYPEIDRMLHPEIRAEDGRGPPDWDRALATVRQAYPGLQGPWRFEVKPSGSIPARYYFDAHHGMGGKRIMAWISTDGSRVLRSDIWGEYAMTFIYNLHFQLLAGETGGAVLGWAGFALLALLISGLWAWWPRGSWRKALRFKRGAHPQRILRDWHKLSGLAGLAFLLILTVTGIVLELPKESDAALNATGLTVDKAPHVHAMPHEGPQIGVDAAVAAGKAALPGSRLVWIETPPVSGGAYKLRIQVPGDPSPRFPHSFVWIDSRDARVLAIQDARQASGGTTVNNWMHPLHDGSVIGLPGRILVALSGLVPLLLFVTGWMRWRGRRRT